MPPQISRLERLRTIRIQNDFVELIPADQIDPKSLEEIFSPDLTKLYLTSFSTFAEYFTSVVIDNIWGPGVVYGVRDSKTGDWLGCTGVFEVSDTHLSAEIGATWFSTASQGSFANAASKLALLSFLFEKMNMNRVFVMMDALNLRSKAAIQKMGFTYEGCFRKHIIRTDGRIRDTLFFSVIHSEWAATKRLLEARIRLKISNGKSVGE